MTQVWQIAALQHRPYNVSSIQKDIDCFVELYQIRSSVGVPPQTTIEDSEAVDMMDDFRDHCKCLNHNDKPVKAKENPGKIEIDPWNCLSKPGHQQRQN